MKLTGADINEQRLTFNSHLNHNPHCDILQLKINWDSFITYCVDINTGIECLEYYSGENYVVGSTLKSQSRMYPVNQIPKKYKVVWNGLKEYYTRKLKNDFTKKETDNIPRSVAFAIANKFYGSDYPLQQSQFDNAAKELGY